MNNKNKSNVLVGLLFTQAISLIGTRMTTIALGIWIYQRTGKAMDLLLIPLFNELPSLLFGNVIGTVVDKLDRKKVIIVSDLGQALGTILLFISIASSGFNPWYLYVVVFIQGIFTTAQEPAADSSIAQLTSPQNRTRVNGIKELSFPAAGVLAPVFAGVLYVNFGIQGVIMVDLMTFVIASGIVFLLTFPEVETSEIGREYSGGFIQEVRGGFGFLTRHSGLLWLVVYMAFINLLINGPIELVIPYVLERTGNELILSWMLALMSIATLSMSVILTFVPLPQNKMLVLFASMCMTSIGLLIFGMASSSFLLGTALFVLMMPLPILNVVFKSILQEKVPQDLHGRVFGSAYQVAYGIAPISFLLSGTLVDNVATPFMQAQAMTQLSVLFGQGKASGMGLIVSIAGLVLLIVTLIFSMVASLRNVETRLKSYN